MGAFGRDGGGINVLDDLRSDDLAGTAPGGEEVNDHKALLSKSGVEVGLAIDHEEVQVSFLRFLVFLEAGRKASAHGRANSRGQVVDAGGGRHGSGEVAFVGDVVGESGGAGCESGAGSVGEGSDGEWSQAASGTGE